MTNIKTSKSFRTGILLAMLLFSACSETSSQQEAAPTEPSTSDIEQIDQESISYNIGTYQEAKAFMNAQVQIPIAEDYVTPEYIISATDQSEAFSEFGNRYPEFYGKEKTDLLDAVMEYPERYIEMINENKALRRQFDPNSRY